MYFESINKAMPNCKEIEVKKEPLQQMQGSRDSDYFFKSGYVIKEKHQEAPSLDFQQKEEQRYKFEKLINFTPQSNKIKQQVVPIQESIPDQSLQTTPFTRRIDQTPLSITHLRQSSIGTDQQSQVVPLSTHPQMMHIKTAEQRKLQEMERAMSLEQRVFYKQAWHVRKRAYVQIGNLLRMKTPLINTPLTTSQIGQNSLDHHSFAMHQEEGENLLKQQAMIGGWLRSMTLDTNSACQFEALKATLSFFQNVEDHELTRQTASTLLPLILDKVGVMRTQTAELIKSMLVLLIDTHILTVLPQLSSRLDSKNQKLVLFCVNLLCAILEEKGDILGEQQILSLFKAALCLLKSSNRSSRVLGNSLLAGVFSQVLDPIDSFVQNGLKECRMAQKKELIQILQNTEKIRAKFYLFDNEKIHSKVARLASGGYEDISIRSGTPLKFKGQNQSYSEEGTMNLIDFLHVDFKDIRLVRDFKTKLNILQETSSKLKKVSQATHLKLEDSSKAAPIILNNLINLLDDKQQLILQQTLSLLISFAKIVGKINFGVSSSKVKTLVNKLFERCKETKKAVVTQLRDTLFQLLASKILTVQIYLELAFLQASKNKNFRVRALPFEFFASLLEMKLNYQKTGKLSKMKQEHSNFTFSSSKQHQFFEEILDYAKITELLSHTYCEQLSRMANNDSSGCVRDAAISIITAGKQLNLEKEAFDWLLDSLSKQRIQQICKKLHLKPISIGNEKVIFLPLITVQKNPTPSKQTYYSSQHPSVNQLSTNKHTTSSEFGHLPGIAEPLLKSIQQTLNSMEFQLSQETSIKLKQKLFVEQMLQQRAEQFEREGIRLLELQKAQANDPSITLCLLSTLKERAHSNLFSASLILHTFSYFLPAVQIAVTSSNASHIATNLFSLLLYCASKSSNQPQLLPIALLDSSITSLYNHLNSNSLFFTHMSEELRNLCKNSSPGQILATMSILFNWIKLRIKGLINNGAPPQALASLASILKSQTYQQTRPHIEAIYASFQEKFKLKLVQLGLSIPQEVIQCQTQEKSIMNEESQVMPKVQIPRIFQDLRQVMIDIQGTSNESRKRGVIGLSQILVSPDLKLLQEKDHSLVLSSLCQLLIELTESSSSNIFKSILDILTSYPSKLENFTINVTIENLGVLLSSIAQKITLLQKKGTKERPQQSAKAAYYQVLSKWTSNLTLKEVCQAIQIAFSQHLQLTTTLGFKYLREILKWLSETFISQRSKFSIYDLEPIVIVLVKGLANAVCRPDCEVIIDQIISNFNREETVKFFEIHLIDSNAHYRIFSDWLDQRTRKAITPVKATFAPKVVMPSPNRKEDIKSQCSSVKVNNFFSPSTAEKEISRIQESDAPSPEERKEYENFQVKELLQSIRTPRGEEIKARQNVNKTSQNIEKVESDFSTRGEQAQTEQFQDEDPQYLHYERVMKKLQMLTQQTPKPEDSFHSQANSINSSVQQQMPFRQRKQPIEEQLKSHYQQQERQIDKTQEREEMNLQSSQSQRQKRRQIEENKRMKDAIRLQEYRAQEVEGTLQKLLKEEREKHRKTLEDLKEANACYFKEMSQKVELQMQLDAERREKKKSSLVKGASPMRTSLTSLQDEALQLGVKGVKSPEFGKQTDESEFQPLSLNDLSDENIQEQLTTTTARKIERVQRGLLKEKTPARYSEIPEEESREYEIRSPSPISTGRSFRARSLSNASFLVNKSLVKGIKGFAEDDELNQSVSEWSEHRERRSTRSLSEEKNPIQREKKHKFIEGVFKIQDVLLRSGDAKQDLEKPLMFMYSRLRGQHQKIKLLEGLVEAMSNEDVLFALKDGQFKCLIGVVLNIYSKEKDLLMKDEINKSRHVFDTSVMSQPTGQTEVTKKSQQLLSIILNSKQFTNSLCTLVSLISEKIPADFSDPLSNGKRSQRLETKIFVRVSLRCITQILKELVNDENPSDCVRVFEVLFSLNQLFVAHPPETLSERLPSINELNFIYQSLKQVTDTLIKIHPQKVSSFVDFIGQRGASIAKSQANPPSAFVVYLKAFTSN